MEAGRSSANAAKTWISHPSACCLAPGLDDKSPSPPSAPRTTNHTIQIKVRASDRNLKRPQHLPGALFTKKRANSTDNPSPNTGKYQSMSESNDNNNHPTIPAHIKEDLLTPLPITQTMRNPQVHTPKHQVQGRPVAGLLPDVHHS